MKTYWTMRDRFNTLRGGSAMRLAMYRRDLAKSLETIRGCRTPEAAEDFIKNSGYTSPLTHRHSWMGDAHGLNIGADDKARGYVSAPWGLVDGWRDAGDVSDILQHSRAYPGAYYSDADCIASYDAHVWQLPARADASQYVAGYIGREGGRDDGRGSGYVVLLCDSHGLETFEDKDAAARAADGLAERMAEREREYSQRWQDASEQDSEREQARAGLRAAHETARRIVAALRELPPVADGAADAFSIARAQLRAGLDDARGTMREALEEIGNATARIAELGMTGEF